MAFQQLYGKPKPKIPAYANRNIRDTIADDNISAATLLAPRAGINTNLSGAKMFLAAGDTTNYDQQPIAYPKVAQGTPRTTAAAPGQPASNRFVSGLKSIAPYATNIANMFVKPPLPPAPSYMAPVNFQRANLDADRAIVAQQERGNDVVADRYLDGNNAVASRIAGSTQSIKALTSINGQERHENQEIANREISTNSNIEARNLGSKNQYDRDVVERAVALQSARSSNLADLSDKYVAGNNQQGEKKLDADKLKILSKMSPDVWSRLMDKLKKDGVNIGGK
jgi:hypothetical protein